MWEDKAFERFKEQVLRDGPHLGADDRFHFQCHRNLSCFNHCCHDVNIFLTPYDIVRMKRGLGITSGEFLDRYCIIPFSKTMRYPVVLLRMREEAQLACPFLEEPDGCSIYENRPWSCRTYPLGRAAPPKKAGTEAPAFYFLIREDFCCGLGESREWRVAEWLDDQGVTEYEAQGRSFQELVQDERLGTGKSLTPEQMDMLFMVLYDLDKFRRFVFETRFLRKFEVAEDRVEAIRADDVELMKFGFDWLRFALWQEPTLEVRAEVAAVIKAAMEARPGAQAAGTTPSNLSDQKPAGKQDESG
ncbi:MAG: YkgJ family cysteine cluster protein [Candidatus Sumerlaeia bacterium]|nr:YkgJ family cysteine cluster protein [Candidatus Sumerlaeia bacterium]